MNNPFFQRLVATNDSIGTAVLRIAIGLILMPHGAQKLFGMFGGMGIAGTGQYFASLGLNPGELMAVLAGGAEFFGGLLLVIGLLVRPAAIVIGFAMLVAIVVVHLSKGFFVTSGGYEYALTLFVVMASLLISGAGGVSIDRALNRRFVSDGDRMAGNSRVMK